MKTTLILAALFFTRTLSYACCIPSGDVTAYGNSDSLSMSGQGDAVLSINLLNFEGMLTNQSGVALSWNTMMEMNVDHFEIERSGDGMTFQDIIKVVSQMKISTNVYQLKYQATDPNPLPGLSYYRIKVIGKNGATSLSPVIQISNSNLVDGTKIYPTLVQNNMVFVESDKSLHSVRMEFFDLSGKKISETDWDTLDGRQSASVSRSGYLPTGTYLARLTANGQNVKNQLVIVQSH